VGFADCVDAVQMRKMGSVPIFPRWGQLVIVAALLAVAAELAHMHVAAQIYYPVVQLVDPQVGLTYTAVQDETADRRACGEANDRFIDPIRAACPQCKVVFARCARELDGIAAALYANRAAVKHLVLSPGMRLGIEGNADAAERSCTFIADDMVKRGYRSAVCVHPQK